MLSFYEFDCLLRKQQKPQKMYHEALSDELKAKLAAMLAKKPAATAAVQAPPPEPAAPAAQPAAQQPPAQGGEPDPLAQLASKLGTGNTRGIPRGRGQRRQGSVPGGPQRPAIVRPNKDVNDPEVKDYGFGRASGSISRQMGTTGTGTQADERAARDAERFQKWNTFMRSPTFSYYTAVALKKLGVPVDPKFLGVPGPDGQPTTKPMPFAIATAKGASGQSEREEVIVADPRLLMRAISLANNSIQTQRERDPMAAQATKDLDFRSALLSQAAGDEKMLPVRMLGAQLGAQQDDEVMQVAQRALQFEKMIRHHSYTGEYMSIKDLATALGREAGPAAGGVGAKHDPILDIKAVIHMVKTDQMGKYHIFHIPASMNKSRKIGLDTVVAVNPPQDLGKLGRKEQDPVMSSRPIAAGGAAPPEREKDVQASLRSALRRRSAAKKAQQRPAPEGPATAAEATQWMEIQALLEHWGF